MAISMDCLCTGQPYAPSLAAAALLTAVLMRRWVLAPATDLRVVRIKILGGDPTRKKTKFFYSRSARWKLGLIWLGVLSIMLQGVGCSNWKYGGSIKSVLNQVGPIPSIEVESLSIADVEGWQRELNRWKAAVVEFHHRVNGIDISSCPEDFRTKFYEVVESARNLRKLAEQEIPADESQGVAIYLRNLASNKEYDGGIKRIRAAMLDGDDHLKKSYTELMVVSAKYE